MGLFEDDVDAVLDAGARTVDEIARGMDLRLFNPPRRAPRHRISVARILVYLRAHPERFVEIAPGRWVRRRDGDNGAGVASRPPSRPLAGGAAVAAEPPRPPLRVEAVARPPAA